MKLLVSILYFVVVASNHRADFTHSVFQTRYVQWTNLSAYLGTYLEIPQIFLYEWKGKLFVCKLQLSKVDLTMNVAARMFEWIVWYFVTKIVRTYCEKKIVLVIEKFFWNLRLKAENMKIFEITRTIDSNSKRSEQSLVTEWFF